MILIVTLFLIGTILVATIISVVTIQQRRLLHTRSTFAGRLLHAQDRERAAIARELHDDLVQRLHHVSHQLRTGEFDGLEGVVKSVDRVAGELRGLAHGIHPTGVDHQPLTVALQNFATAISVEGRFEVAVKTTGDPSVLDRTGRLTLFRVAQEAIRNAQEHSATIRVMVEVERLPNDITLTVRDWGSGFEIGHMSDRVGLGLISMEERMRLLRGQLRIESALNVGTTVTAILPLPASR